LTGERIASEPALRQHPSMRAAYYESMGSAAQVLRVGLLPEPVPGSGEVRVRVRWSGVNPTDIKTRSGARGTTGMPFPRVIPHSDGMGHIDAVGAGVAPSRVGQRVWTWNAAWGRPDGTAAEYVVLPAAQAVPLPDEADDAAGACLGIPALTALHAVLADGGVEGQRVLVAGGAGAVGHYAIQFARRLGARQVLATVSSADKAALARQAGATDVVNYRDPDAAQQLRAAAGGQGVDRIVEVDIAANAALDQAVMRRGALWMVYGSGAREFTMPFFPLIADNAKLRFYIVFHLADDERAVAVAVLDDLLRRRALIHNIALRLPLEQIAQAHDAVEQGRVAGNVVLSIE
jgi:NADPH:quinone reductase